MSVSLNIKAFASKNSDDFKKHFKAVKFCIENELSFPKETSDFFKGKVSGDDLEDILPEYLLGYIENGVEIEIPTETNEFGRVKIKISDIPSCVNELIINID